MNFRRHSERGNTLILVMAMLSLLGLAVIAFSYGARLESIASSNFSRRVQARMTSYTGFSVALPLMNEATSVTTTLQPWNQALVATSAPIRTDAATRGSRLTRRAAANASPSVAGTNAGDPGQTVIGIADLSARVNLNTVRSPKSLERFLEAVFSRAGGTGVRSATQTRARATLALRDGRLANARTADTLTTATMQPDLRLAPASSGRRIESLSQLTQGDASLVSRALFTPAELQVLAPFVTTFSQSPEVYNSPTGSRPKVALQGELDARETLPLLKQAFPQHDERLLMQFAVNLQDFTDADNTPTVMTDPAHPEPWNALFGVEKAPLITEVYPDSMGLNGDAGQFVEIHNPWNEPIAMTNWRLAVGGGMGVGEPSISVAINTTIAPGGYIIVTDNYDNPPLDSEVGAGSFLSVFGARADSDTRRIVVDPGFMLPDENSFVALADATGAAIDVFSYTTTAGRNTHRSYQRNDPRVRSFDVADATPFEHTARAASSASPANSNATRSLHEAWQERGNAPLTSPVDLLRISTAYSGLRGNGTQVALQPHPYQTPALRPADAGAKNATNLDVRLVDLFTVPQQWAKPAVAKRTAAKKTDEANTGDVHYSFGKLNVNTCSALALYSLDLEVDGRDYFTPQWIDAFERHRTRQLGQRQTPFLNTSDLLVALFPKPSETDLAVFAKLLDQVTVGSSSFEVVTSNRTAQTGGEAQADNRAAAVSRTYWAVSLDSQPCSILAVRSLR